MQDYFLARCIQRPEDWLPCNLMVTTRLKNHLVIVNLENSDSGIILFRRILSRTMKTVPAFRRLAQTWGSKSENVCLCCANILSHVSPPLYWKYISSSGVPIWIISHIYITYSFQTAFFKNKASDASPVLVPFLSLYPLQSLLSLHTAALSLGRQWFLVLSIGGGEKTSQSRPEGKRGRRNKGLITPLLSRCEAVVSKHVLVEHVSTVQHSETFFFFISIDGVTVLPLLTSAVALWQYKHLNVFMNTTHHMLDIYTELRHVFVCM